MTGTVLREQEIEKVLILAQHGLTGAEIARFLDRSDTVISNVLRDYGVAPRRHQRTADQTTLALTLHRSGNIRPGAMALHALPEPEPEKPEPPAPKVVQDEIGAERLDGGGYVARLKRWLGKEEGETAAESFVCKDCDADFVITLEHQEWFQSRGINVPKRCEPCRGVRKGQHDYDIHAEVAELKRRLDDLIGRLEDAR